MQRYDETTALVVVDIQNDFADPGGGLSVRGGAAIIPIVNREIDLATNAGALVIATQDWHPESTPHFAKDGGIWPVHCIAGTWGAELHPDLVLPADAPRVRKGANGEDGYSGFTMRDATSGEETPTALDGLLRDEEIRRVEATALDAARLGYDTALLTDAVAAVELEPGDGERAIGEMADAGVALWQSRTR